MLQDSYFLGGTAIESSWSIKAEQCVWVKRRQILIPSLPLCSCHWLLCAFCSFFLLLLPPPTPFPQENDICLLDNNKLRQRLKHLQDLLYLYELQLKDILENTYHRTKSGLFSGNRSMQHEALLPATSGNLIVYDQGTFCMSICGSVSLQKSSVLPAVSLVSHFIPAKIYSAFKMLKWVVFEHAVRYMEGEGQAVALMARGFPGAGFTRPSFRQPPPSYHLLSAARFSPRDSSAEEKACCSSFPLDLL